MSLQAPQNIAEQKFQYCNYGFDKSKFRDFNDCMANYKKIDWSKEAEKNIQNNLILAQNQASMPIKTNTNKEPLFYILVTAGVMIAGYFAYKKFKN